MCRLTEHLQIYPPASFCLKYIMNFSTFALDPIALLGNTGTETTGAHLHFELWHDGETVDPTLYINF